MSSFVTTPHWHDLFVKPEPADWRRVSPNRIGLAASIAYPEGGGQLGDHGTVRQGEVARQFVDTQKAGGRDLSRPDFPIVKGLDGEVQLVFQDPVPDEWDEMQPVTIEVDMERRVRLARSHTAAHLLFLALQEVLPGCVQTVQGCLVEPDGGRFDLSDTSLNNDHLPGLSEVVERWRASRAPIVIEELAADARACRMWVCGDARIPCGGLHVPHCGLVCPVALQRKKKGKALVRIYYSLDAELHPELMRMVHPSATP